MTKEIPQDKPITEDEALDKRSRIIFDQEVETQTRGKEKFIPPQFDVTSIIDTKNGALS